jgi:hypothetical protein
MSGFRLGSTRFGPPGIPMTMPGGVPRQIRFVGRLKPDAPPEEVIRLLGRQYTATVASIGAGAGAVAAAPGIGLAGAVGYAAFDIGTFTAA